MNLCNASERNRRQSETSKRRTRGPKSLPSAADEKVRNELGRDGE